jgi:hypothetical protein
MLEGLPQTSRTAAANISATSGRTAVVALWSKYNKVAYGTSLSHSLAVRQNDTSGPTTPTTQPLPGITCDRFRLDLHSQANRLYDPANRGHQQTYRTVTLYGPLFQVSSVADDPHLNRSKPYTPERRLVLPGSGWALLCSFAITRRILVNFSSSA